jgi:PKD repeat protein
MNITFRFINRKLFLTWFFAVGLMVFSSAQEITIHPSKIHPLKLVYVSAALKDLPDAPPPTAAELSGPRKERENPSLENHLPPLLDPDHFPKGPDGALQRNYNKRTRGGVNSVTTVADTLSNWDGLSTQVEPSDNVIAVGPNHVMQMTNNSNNSAIRIWNKSGTSIHNYTTDMVDGGLSDGGDPNPIYDWEADRFLFVLLDATYTQFIICVSQTADPTGAWYTYSFTPGNGGPDYPKISMWGNSYFITSNSFTPTIFALDRATMIAGTGTGTVQEFDLSAFPTIGFQSFAPVTFTGSMAPPVGSPAIMISPADSAWGSSVGPSHLELYKVSIDWNNSSNSTVSTALKLHPIPYNSYLCGFGNYCIPMPGTNQKLDPLSDVIMDKAQYRYHGGIESIVCSHVCNADGNGTAGVRWYELRRDTANDWHIYQQGTYSMGTNSRFMSSITINENGTIALGYNISSHTLYPGIRITGRNICDTINRMTVPEEIIKTGAYSNGSSRYGDYNSMVTDPSDGSFWFSANYNPTSDNNWATNIVHFTITPCSNAPPIASYTTNTSTGCDSLCVTFNDASQSDTARLWHFTGAVPDTSSQLNPTVCYQSPGTYSVSLIALNSFGNDTLVQNNAITVYQSVKPTFTVNGSVLISSFAPSYQWYDSTGAIAGATTKNYVVHHSGYYHVCTVDANGCPACSDSVFILVNGINNVSSDEMELQLYPNPVKGGSILTISFSKNIIKGELNVFNVMSEKVYFENFSGRQKTVSMKLSAGVYFLQIKDGDRQYIRKLIIQ